SFGQDGQLVNALLAFLHKTCALALGLLVEGAILVLLLNLALSRSRVREQVPALPAAVVGITVDTAPMSGPTALAYLTDDKDTAVATQEDHHRCLLEKNAPVGAIGKRNGRLDST